MLTRKNIILLQSELEKRSYATYYILLEPHNISRKVTLLLISAFCLILYMFLSLILDISRRCNLRIEHDTYVYLAKLAPACLVSAAGNYLNTWNTCRYELITRLTYFAKRIVFPSFTHRKL